MRWRAPTPRSSTRASGSTSRPYASEMRRISRARAVADAVQLLGSEDDVLEDGEVVGELEVLEHHADPGIDGVGRRGEVHLAAVDSDRALVGALDAVEDLHQRGLAGAVLADDGVDGAAARP